MKKLYSMEEAGKWQKKARLYGGLLVFVAAAALLACIYLCTLADGRNTEKLLIPVMIISTLAGWAVMLGHAYLRRPAKARAQHMKGMLAGEEEMFEGVLQRTGETFSIPGSVTVKKMALVNGEERVLLHADSVLARQLPKDGTRVRLLAVRKYITGYEVLA